MHWRSGHKIDCHRLVDPLDASVSILGNAACTSVWPEYEIEIEDECSFDSELSQNISPSNFLVTIQNRMDQAFQSLSDTCGADNDKENWASFQQRIAKVPKQVLRYCRDVAAKPLWPLLSGRPTEADTPKCNYCKGPLCYEFQLVNHGIPAEMLEHVKCCKMERGEAAIEDYEVLLRQMLGDEEVVKALFDAHVQNKKNPRKGVKESENDAGLVMFT